MSEVNPFIYAHELLDTVNGTGGIWLGCADEQSVKAAHIPGETGEHVIALYKSEDYDTLRTANQRLEAKCSLLDTARIDAEEKQWAAERENRRLEVEVARLREALQELLYAWDQSMSPIDGVAEDARAALAGDGGE